MKTKVFIIIDSLGPGGAQRQIVEYLKLADHTRFEIAIINMDKNYDTLANQIDQSKCRIIGITHSGFINLLTLIKLTRLFKKEKPDIVHTYLFTADCYGRLSAKLAGVPACGCTLAYSAPKSFLALSIAIVSTSSTYSQPLYQRDLG